MSKVNRKDPRTKRTDVVLVSFGVNQTAKFFKGNEIKYKQKLKFIVYFEQILQCALVFLLLTLKR